MTAEDLSKEIIYNFIVASGTIDKTVKKLSFYIKGDINDYIQDLYVQVFSVPIEKLVDIYLTDPQNLLNYCASICIYNLSNDKSKVHKNCCTRSIGTVSLEELLDKNYEFDNDVTTE